MTRGQRGQQWRFDFLAVAKWRYGAAEEAEVEQDPEKLDPKARLDWYRGTRERTKHMEECAELIPAADLERALSEAFKITASTLESLPDVLERDAGLDGVGVETCVKVIDRVREDLHKRLVSA
jgi:phage terminase Nu1 subunit (DNA packaging protein)